MPAICLSRHQIIICQILHFSDFTDYKTELSYLCCGCGRESCRNKGFLVCLPRACHSKQSSKHQKTMTNVFKNRTKQFKMFENTGDDSLGKDKILLKVIGNHR